jgi:hypothetical protein
VGLRRKLRSKWLGMTGVAAKGLDMSGEVELFVRFSKRVSAFIFVK